MSGHNKWSKIKHKKAVTDAKKSKEFSKLVKLLKVEAKTAQGNIENPGLKSAIEKAKDANMPKDNIDRAIKSATGAGSETLESVTYETYGPGGVAVIVEAITDNKNRTAAEIKHLLSDKGLSLASPGSASWAFTKKDDGWEAQNTLSISEDDKTSLEKLIDALEEQEDVQNIFTNAS